MSDKIGSGKAIVPDVMRDALEVQLAAAARDGGSISIGRVVQALQTAWPDTGVSPIELAEAVLREASARGIPVSIG